MLADDQTRSGIAKAARMASLTSISINQPLVVSALQISTCGFVLHRADLWYTALLSVHTQHNATIYCTTPRGATRSDCQFVRRPRVKWRIPVSADASDCFCALPFF